MGRAHGPFQGSLWNWVSGKKRRRVAQAGVETAGANTRRVHMVLPKGVL